MTSNRRELIKLWIDWTLVNATSFSTYVLLLVIMGHLADWFQSGFFGMVATFLGFSGIGGVGLAQQFILHKTPLRNAWWAALIYVGLLVGLPAGCAGLIPVALLVRGTLGELLGVGFVSFCFGAALGGIQSYAYTRSYSQHAIWIVASGLGVAAFNYSLLGFFSSSKLEPTSGRYILAATLAGIAYGGVSGFGLVWLVRLHYSMRADSIAFFRSRPSSTV